VPNAIPYVPIHYISEFQESPNETDERDFLLLFSFPPPGKRSKLMTIPVPSILVVHCSISFYALESVSNRRMSITPTVLRINTAHLSC